MREQATVLLAKKRREVNGKIFATRRTDAGKKSKRSAESAEHYANSLAAVMVESIVQPKTSMQTQ